MATNYYNVEMGVVDASGNLNVIYPVTTANNVAVGTNETLASRLNTINSNINSRALLKKVTVSSIDRSKVNGNVYTVKFSLSSSVSSYAGGIAFSSFSFSAGSYFFVGLVSLINTTNEQGAIGGKNVIAMSGIQSGGSSPVSSVNGAYFDSSYTTFNEIVVSSAISTARLYSEDFYVLK